MSTCGLPAPPPWRRSVLIAFKKPVIPNPDSSFASSTRASTLRFTSPSIPSSKSNGDFAPPCTAFDGAIIESKLSAISSQPSSVIASNIFLDSVFSSDFSPSTRFTSPSITLLSPSMTLFNTSADATPFKSFLTLLSILSSTSLNISFAERSLSILSSTSLNISFVERSLPIFDSISFIISFVERSFTLLPKPLNASPITSPMPPKSSILSKPSISSTDNSAFFVILCDSLTTTGDVGTVPGFDAFADIGFTRATGLICASSPPVIALLTGRSTTVPGETDATASSSRVFSSAKLMRNICSFLNAVFAYSSCSLSCVASCF